MAARYQRRPYRPYPVMSRRPAGASSGGARPYRPYPYRPWPERTLAGELLRAIGVLLGVRRRR